MLEPQAAICMPSRVADTPCNSFFLLLGHDLMTAKRTISLKQSVQEVPLHCILFTQASLLRAALVYGTFRSSLTRCQRAQPARSALNSKIVIVVVVVGSR